MKDYLVILERGETSWGAYCPDVPGCVAAAETREEALRLFRGALQAHFEETLHDGEPIPPPVSEAATVSVDVERLLAAA